MTQFEYSSGSCQEYNIFSDVNNLNCANDFKKLIDTWTCIYDAWEGSDDDM